jgi:acetyl esterase/lipase
VDYRLAPANPYPDPVNDAFQAYVWIITQAKKQLGMDLEQIIVAGDSAGGHLACSVSFLAFLRGYRKPDGILMLYPVFSVGTKFYPSTLLSVDEELLSTTFLKFVLACFTRAGGNPDKNPIASPITAPLALFRRALPKAALFASECDVLRDQSLHFLDKLLSSDPGDPDRAHLYFMKEYMHGWCNMN